MWTADRKIGQVQKETATDFISITYHYDGSGNRILQKIKKYSKAGNISDTFISTYFVRDVGGNIMATYNDKGQVQEFNILGGLRLGVYKILYEDIATNNPTKKALPKQDDYGKLILGYRNYELSNHLGNVLAVISDKKLPNLQSDVVSANDYYPFGMTIKSRSFDGNYRFGFQGQEVNKEFNGTINYKYRIHDPVTGRFYSIDPLYRKYWYTIRRQKSSTYS